jgi:hypothetical protein
MTTKLAGRFQVGFVPDDYLNDLWYDHQELDEKALAKRYAEALGDELRPLLQSVQVKANPRPPLVDGGPGAEFDFVEFVVVAGGALGLYAGVRQVAGDIRAAMNKLAALGDGRVRIDEPTAVLLATDAVADEKTFADIEVVSTVTLRGADEWGSDRGYIVELVVNGDRRHVVVTSSGGVLGATGGTGSQASLASIDNAPEPPTPQWEKPPGATDEGSWIETDDGGWQWVEDADAEITYDEPSEAEREAARKRIAELEDDPKYQSPRPPTQRRKPKA